MLLSSLVKLWALSMLKCKERCVSNLNEEYTNEHIEECALDLNMNLTTTGVIYESWNIVSGFLFNDKAFDGTDDTYYPPDKQWGTNLIDWRSKTLENFPVQQQISLSSSSQPEQHNTPWCC